MKPAVVMLLLALSIAVGSRLAAPSDIYDQDQPKTIAYTADIVLNGRWVLPRDDSGMPATKPPLLNWLGALAVMATGRWDEWILKLPSLLAGIATLVMVMHFTRLLVGRAAAAASGNANTFPESSAAALSADPTAIACLAGILWLTAYPIVKLIYLARPDMLLIACLTAAWLCATRAIDPQTPRHRAWALGFWLAVTAAALTKGPPAVLPLLYAPLAARLLHKRWSLAGRLGWWWGLPIMLIVSGLWLYGAYLGDPRHFVNRLVGREVVERAGRKGPLGPLLTIYRMPVYFVRYFLPASIVVIICLIRIGPRRWMAHPVSPAILWLLLCLGFFSLAAGGRSDYIAPAYAAGVIIATFSLAYQFRRLSVTRWCAAGVAIVLGIACYLFFGSDAAREQDGVAIKKFVAAVRPVVGDDAIDFRGQPTYPIQTLLGRHPSIDDHGPDAAWVIGPVRGGATPEVDAGFFKDRWDNPVRIGLYRFGRDNSPPTTAPVAVAADHPAWTELAKLYGKSKDSDSVKAFVREHKLKEATKGGSGIFTSEDHAYSILYSARRIQTIVIRVTPPPVGYAQDNWRSYSKALPHGLIAGDGRPGVVAKLGQPTKPDGDRWNKDGFEIWIFFNDEKTGINELYVWPTDNQP